MSFPFSLLILLLLPFTLVMCLAQSDVQSRPKWSSISCRFYHKYYDDYKPIEMVETVCSARRYCIHVIYKDSNPSKKQGYSVGCDRNDCEELDDPMVTGWSLDSSGAMCRKHRHYGDSGRVCCCKTNMCNHSGRSYSLLSAVTSLILGALCLLSL